MRELYMDNRYSAPHLFVLLCEKYMIIACGTVKLNPKGWDQKIMNLPKSSQRGSSPMKFNPVNQIFSDNGMTTRLSPSSQSWNISDDFHLPMRRSEHCQISYSQSTEMI